MNQVPEGKDIDPEYNYDDQEEGLWAEKRAVEANLHLNPKAMPTRAYLDSTVVPLLHEAMKKVVFERPANPAEFIAYYLLQNNPYTKKQQEEKS